MKVIKINKKDWENGINQSKKEYQLFGPVKEKDNYIFKKLQLDEYPDMEHKDTLVSPKSILFPQTEKILQTNLDESIDDHHIMKQVKKDYSKRAVISIKPYDAKAIQILNLNFDTDEYKDPYWCEAYKATTFIGLAVNNPSVFDFSSSTNTGPFAEQGLDVLLIDCSKEYLAKVLTDKGQAFLDVAGFNQETDNKKAIEIINNMKKKAENAISSQISTQNLKDKNTLDLYEAPFWDDIAFSCINCGTCSFVCPTCWCFDIQDETKGNLSYRIRNWDTCMSPLFTLHASGHNPRGEKTMRVRQRFMHKLKYFLDKYDNGIMCVGCGRCVKLCPVNIDIRKVCNLMNSHEPDTDN
ncbi:MAG: 4Fe-4S ferredoxin [Desulfobacteraceae bacterium 4572_130]|nr:MAG: 4Fe-4S ferredoxin [Desulfobacteraceae bacterium 4572_130]